MMGKLIIIFISVVILAACQAGLPEFDGNNAYEHIINQCDFGPRYPGSDGIELCRDYIITNLEKHDAIVELQPFTVTLYGEEIEGVNIIGSLYPRMGRRIMLGTHYDTRPWADQEEDSTLHDQPVLGANDGASGVAVLLELCRIISQKQPPQYGVDFVFFDLEDMGDYDKEETWALGAQHFAKNFTGQKPEKVIVVDMVGQKGLKIEMEYYSYHNSPALVNEVWDIGRKLGFDEFVPSIGRIIIDDHLPLIRAGFNAILIIDFDYPYWHTLEDTPDKCSPESLYVVGQTLTNLIYQEK